MAFCWSGSEGGFEPPPGATRTRPSTPYMRSVAFGLVLRYTFRSDHLEDLTVRARAAIVPLECRVFVDGKQRDVRRGGDWVRGAGRILGRPDPASESPTSRCRPL
jgi:hypothetical protein